VKDWRDNFDERQQKEIEFSVLYLNQFEHGTDGHNAKIIIAKMASLLDKVQVALLTDNFDEELAPLARQALGIEGD